MCKLVTVLVLVFNADRLSQLMDVQEYDEILLQLIVSVSLSLWLHTFSVRVYISELYQIFLALQNWTEFCALSRNSLYLVFPDRQTTFYFIVLDKRALKTKSWCQICICVQ